MRIVFFGTPEFAVPTLSRLLAEPDIEVVGVVTQPDARRGRGNQTSPPPVKEIALQHSLTIWQPDRLKKDTEVLAGLAATQADAFVVVAYGQILSQAILDMPKYGCINVHGSLLPKYRGAAPIQWAIAIGETVTGITTMQMDAGVDTGAMLLKASLDIAPEDQAESLSAKLAIVGADLLIETLKQLGTLFPEPQNNAEASYAPIIGKELWQLDWSQGAIALHNRIRGFYPNCYTTHREQRLKITASEVVAEPDRIEQPAGAIAALSKNVGFSVQTGAGQLLIKEVQPAGKRLQTAWEFANGARLQIGEIMGR